MTTKGDAQERVPALFNDMLEEPAGVQPPIGKHQHGPVGGHTAVQVVKEREPMRAPGTLTGSGYHGPRDRNRTHGRRR